MPAILDSLLALLLLMTGVWCWSLSARDASIIDRWWGMGFVAVAVVALWRAPVVTTRAALLFWLVLLWGTRLTWHITRRNHGAGEDARYAAMRAAHGASFWWKSLYRVFWLQAVVLWVVAWPIWTGISAASTRNLTTLDWSGLALFALGFGFEAVGDWQLARFKADPANRGRVLDRGLWRYTRHPNYFGDATLWWGLGLLGVAGDSWWVLVSPLVMTTLLIHVSGAALLERQLLQTKPAYAEYVGRTSRFFPWWPRA